MFSSALSKGSPDLLSLSWPFNKSRDILAASPHYIWLTPLLSVSVLSACHPPVTHHPLPHCVWRSARPSKPLIKWDLHSSRNVSLKHGDQASKQGWILWIPSFELSNLLPWVTWKTELTDVCFFTFQNLCLFYCGKCVWFKNYHIICWVENPMTLSTFTLSHSHPPPACVLLS